MAHARKLCLSPRLIDFMLGSSRLAEYTCTCGYKACAWSVFDVIVTCFILPNGAATRPVPCLPLRHITRTYSVPYSRVDSSALQVPISSPVTKLSPMKPIQRVFEEVPSGQTRHCGLFTPCTLSPCSHEVAIFDIVRRGLVWQVARSRCSRFSMIHVIPLSASEKPHGDSPASYVFCCCCYSTIKGMTDGCNTLLHETYNASNTLISHNSFNTTITLTST